MTESNRKLRLALIQFEGKLCDTRGNTSLACEQIAQAAAKGADMVVLPELFSTGYQLNVVGPRLPELAEPDDGPTVQALCEAARAGKCYVIAGIALTHGMTGVVYNSSVIIDRQGQVMGYYDKQHLWALERFYFHAGCESPVFETEFGTFGVMICYDMGFPEVARTLTLKGADLIVCPSAWCAEDMDVWYINSQCRALENTVWLAAVNRYGVEEELVMPGHTHLCNGRGTIVDELHEECEGILYQDIDLSAVIEHRVTNPYLRDRHPELYGLVSQAI